MLSCFCISFVSVLVQRGGGKYCNQLVIIIPLACAVPFSCIFKTPLLLRLLNLVCIQSLAYLKLSLTCWFPAPSVLLTAWLPGWRPAGCGCFSSARWESHQSVYIYSYLCWGPIGTGRPVGLHLHQCQLSGLYGGRSTFMSLCCKAFIGVTSAKPACNLPFLTY